MPSWLLERKQPLTLTERASGKLRAGVGRSFRSGGFVLITTLGLRNALRLASNVALAHLLYPEAFGIVGLIGAVMFVLELSSDLGIRAFIIRHEKGATREYRNVVWTVAVLRGVVLTILMVLAAYPVSVYFQAEALHSALIVCAPLLLINSLRSLAMVVAVREGKIASVSLLELAGYCLQLTVTLLLALQFRTFWPLIVGMFVNSIFLTGASYFVLGDATQKIQLSKEVIGELWKFSRVIALASFITLVLQQADKAILGRLYNLETLGLYFVAFNLTAAARQVIMEYYRRVLFPRFAHTVRENDVSLKEVFYREQVAFACLAALGCGFGAGASGLIFGILYDDRYAQAGTFFSILVLGLLLLNRSEAASQVLVAVGRIKVELIGNVLRLVWLAVTVPIGYSTYGMIGIVAAFASMHLLPLFYLWVNLNGLKILRLRTEVMLATAGTVGFVGGWTISLPFG